MKFLISLMILLFITSCATSVQDDYNKGVTYAFTNRYQEATPLLTRACEGKIGEACHLRGALDKNNNISLTYYKKGCDLGNKDSCMAITKTLQTVFENYEKSCALGFKADCDKASTFLYSIINIEHSFINLEEAKILYEKLCSLGSGIACYHRSAYEVSETNKTIQGAKVYLNKACDLDEPFSCYLLGELFFYTNPSKANAYYAKSCSKKIQAACRRREGLPINDKNYDMQEAYCHAGFFDDSCKVLMPK